MILGAGGKSGVLCARRGAPRAGGAGATVVGVESYAPFADELETLGLCNHVVRVDARDPVATREAVLADDRRTRGRSGALVRQRPRRGDDARSFAPGTAASRTSSRCRRASRRRRWAPRAWARTSIWSSATASRTGTRSTRCRCSATDARGARAVRTPLRLISRKEDIMTTFAPRRSRTWHVELGIDDAHLEPYGRSKAKISLDALGRAPRGKGRLVLVTAINPTPAGEGKTTTSIGLAMGMRRLGKNAVARAARAVARSRLRREGRRHRRRQGLARRRPTTSTSTSPATSTPSRPRTTCSSALVDNACHFRVERQGKGDRSIRAR